MTDSMAFMSKFDRWACEGDKSNPKNNMATLAACIVHDDIHYAKKVVESQFPDRLGDADFVFKVSLTVRQEILRLEAERDAEMERVD